MCWRILVSKLHKNVKAANYMAIWLTFPELKKSNCISFEWQIHKLIEPKYSTRINYAKFSSDKFRMFFSLVATLRISNLFSDQYFYF